MFLIRLSFCYLYINVRFSFFSVSVTSTYLCVSHSSLFLLLLHICAFVILLPFHPFHPNPPKSAVSHLSPVVSPFIFLSIKFEGYFHIKKKVPSQTKNFVLAHIESLRIKLLSLSLNLNCRGGGGGFSFCCSSATNIRVNFPQI